MKSERDSYLNRKERNDLLEGFHAEYLKRNVMVSFILHSK